MRANSLQKVQTLTYRLTVRFLEDGTAGSISRAARSADINKTPMEVVLDGNSQPRSMESCL
jgi:hypothetical protein